MDASAFPRRGTRGSGHGAGVRRSHEGGTTVCSMFLIGLATSGVNSVQVITAVIEGCC